MSAWQDEAALAAFVGRPPHRDAMAALQSHMGDDVAFVRWRVRGSDLPLRWDDAMRRAAKPAD